jgi:hypothetical protein
MAANAMVPVRTIKVRSVVDATYSKNYNRLEFNIDPDNMSTDLSESYLALRMYLAHEDLTRYTAGELSDLASKGIYVSFGNAGISYDPTCLIKLARLYARNNQSTPLEEINFQNVLSTTLHQICEDFEAVGSSSLVSNSSVVFGAPQSLTSFFANLLPDSIGGTDTQLPIEIHIPLKKIFGFFENKNCYLDDEALGGLRLVFELEDQKQLLQAQVVTENVACPAVVGADGLSGLLPSLSVNPYTSLTDQPDIGAPTQGLFGNEPLVPPNTELPFVGTTGGNILNPAFFTLWYPQIADVSFNATTTVITCAGDEWTDAIAESMWIVADNYARMTVATYPDPNGQFNNQRQTVMMASMFKIVSAVVAGGILTIVLDRTMEGNAGGDQPDPFEAGWLSDVDHLDFFDVASNAAPEHFGQHIVALQPQTKAQYLADLVNNQITISVQNLSDIVSAGLVASDGDAVFVGTGAQFKLSCQVMGDLGENPNTVPIEPDFNFYISPDQPNTRLIQSNMLQALPMQGDKVAILSIVSNGAGAYTMTTTDLGFANRNSLQPIIRVAGTTYNDGDNFDGEALEIKYHLYITNFNNATDEYDGVTELYPLPLPDYTYLIDKSELVLVQQGRQKGVPMSRMYFTSKVESATIETQLPIYTRQFVVTEPNVYSILLCTPQYVATATQPECLASWHRGVSRYRWSVNNIDDTNRDLEVWTNTSHYPSSLHLEKLMDAMANDGHTVKSLSGLLTVPQGYNPIVPFPLKIFDAMDTPLGIRQHPSGFVVQWTAYGDPIHNSPIQAGNIYLFKRLVKTF